MNLGTNKTKERPTGLAVALMLALVVVSCAGETGTANTGVTDSEVDVDSTTADVDSTTTTEDTTAAGEPVASDQDPCTILMVDEINQVFPGNSDPVTAEGTGCLYDGLRIDLRPLTLEVIEAEEEPTGWEVRPIDIDGADWAVVRIDTNVTDHEKVLDVIAGGANGTVHLIPAELSGEDVVLGSPVYEGLVDLLQTAFERL